MSTHLTDALRDTGVVSRRRHPELIHAIDAAVAAGRLARVLPGVYVPAGLSAEPSALVAALRERHPDAVVTGPTAGHLYGLPHCLALPVTAAVGAKVVSPPGFRLSSRRIDPDWVGERDGLRVTDPRFTVLELIPAWGPDVIDDALRTGLVTLPGLWSAFAEYGSHPGNGHRRRWLRDSRDEPWSAAERLAHRLLRADAITGWRSNLPVVVGRRRRFLDIAFRRRRLAIEVNGWAVHRHTWVDDQARQADLAAAGWRVLPVTWATLTEPGRFVDLVRRALRHGHPRLT